MLLDQGHRIGCCLAVLSLTLWVGCKPSESGPSGTDSNATSAAMNQVTPQAAVASMPVERHASPEETVNHFLTALKGGDQSRATSMLTVIAQQEMAKLDAAIQPPGSSTATFQVTQSEILGDTQDEAHVLSVWSDTEANGTPTTHEIVWILRREATGWAIAGFATRVFEDQPPLILDFENPQELQRKRNAVDAEITRRNQPQTVPQAELR